MGHAWCKCSFSKLFWRKLQFNIGAYKRQEQSNKIILLKQVKLFLPALHYILYTSLKYHQTSTDERNV